MSAADRLRQELNAVRLEKAHLMDMLLRLQPKESHACASYDRPANNLTMLEYYAVVVMAQCVTNYHYSLSEHAERSVNGAKCLIDALRKAQHEGEA